MWVCRLNSVAAARALLKGRGDVGAAGFVLGRASWQRLPAAALARWAGRADVNAADNHGFTALHFACEWGRQEIATLLCNQPGVRLSPVDRYGESPLAVATQSRHETIMALLRSRGAI